MDFELIYDCSRNRGGMIEHVKIRNLEVVLDLLQTSRDTSFKVKLFLLLSAHLVSKNTNFESMIKHKELYEKVSSVLSENPRKSTAALNLLSALLGRASIDQHRQGRPSLALFVSDRVRLSGCLMTMVVMFFRDMMKKEMWTALCRCLAEACRYSEINRMTCSHLVPVCIKKCRAKDYTVVEVLLTLLKNKSNMQLFVQYDGLLIFTNEFQQNRQNMELLNIVAQDMTAGDMLLRSTNILEVLYVLKENFRQTDQMSLLQWASVITFNLQQHCGKREPENETRERLIQDMLEWKPENNLQYLQDSLYGYTEPEVYLKQSKKNKGSRIPMEDKDYCHIFSLLMDSNFSLSTKENNIQSLSKFSRNANSVKKNCPITFKKHRTEKIARFKPNFSSTPIRRILYASSSKIFSKSMSSNLSEICSNAHLPNVTDSQSISQTRHSISSCIINTIKYSYRTVVNNVTNIFTNTTYQKSIQSSLN